MVTRLPEAPFLSMADTDDGMVGSPQPGETAASAGVPPQDSFGVGGSDGLAADCWASLTDQCFADNGKPGLRFVSEESEAELSVFA
jgi:hypothetical protein